MLLALAPLAWSAPEPRGTVTLTEVSGLVVGERGTLWSLEDSGHPAHLIELDAAGAELRRVALSATNRDWEDLAAGPCPTGRCLYVGDIGDNRRRRPSVVILRVPEPAPAAQAATPEVLRFRYPEGPQNAEALVVRPDGRVFVFTKSDAGEATVYEVPAAFGGPEVEARRVGTLPTGTPGPATRATGAALQGDGALLLRTYVALWRFPATPDGWDPAGAAALAVAEEAQGETVAWDEARQGWWTLSERPEGSPPPTLWFTAPAPAP